MTQAEYEAEVCFRLCKSIFATLLAQSIITQEDCQHLIKAAAEKYRAPIGELKVNSVAAEKGYRGRVSGKAVRSRTAAAKEESRRLCQSVHHERRPEEQPPISAGLFCGVYSTPLGLGLCRNVHG